MFGHFIRCECYMTGFIVSAILSERCDRPAYVISYLCDVDALQLPTIRLFLGRSGKFVMESCGSKQRSHAIRMQIRWHLLSGMRCDWWFAPGVRVESRQNVHTDSLSAYSSVRQSAFS